MINWRKISEVGLPTNDRIGYLVSDGKNFDYSDIEISRNGVKWLGGSVYATYSESNGTEFDFFPTHYYPVDELNLPNK